MLGSSSAIYDQLFTSLELDLAFSTFKRTAPGARAFLTRCGMKPYFPSLGKMPM